MKKQSPKKRSKGPSAIVVVEPVPEPPKTPLPIHRRHRQVFVGAGILLLSLVLVWVAGNLFFGTILINNTPVSTRTSDKLLAEKLTASANTYRLPITYPDGQTKTFPLAETGVQISAESSVTATRQAQRRPLQLLAWWRPVTLKTQTIADNKKLQAFVAKNASIVTEAPHDASLAIVDGKIQVTAGTPGKQYGLVHADQAILMAIVGRQKTPLHLHPTALQPNISETTFSATRTQVEGILQQHIAIAIGDQTVTPSPNDIGKWLTFTPDTDTVKTSVNGDALQAYLDTVADDHAQSSRSQVVLGGKILQAGVRASSVGDTHGAATEITGKLLDAKGADTSLPVQYSAFKTVQAPGLSKWIEVDITTKRMYAYDQGQLVRSFLVSAGAGKTPTVTGRFAIYSKYRSQNMYGGNADGSDYFQPNVPYVNYFYRDYAIHGNYWRPTSYFGNINSSHGCVGTTVSDSSWIYTWAPVGTPVIVHT